VAIDKDVDATFSTTAACPGDPRRNVAALDQENAEREEPQSIANDYNQ